MTKYGPVSYEFWQFRLKPGQRMLFKHGLPVPLQPMAFDVLCLLVQNAGRLVTKDEMLKTIWTDKTVEEGNIPVHVCHIRDALGPGNRNRYVATLPGRGYQFVAEVTELPDARARPDFDANNDVPVHFASADGTGAPAPAPEEVIQTVVSLYRTKGYSSRRLELCRHCLSLSEGEQERLLAQVSGQQSCSD